MEKFQIPRLSLPPSPRVAKLSRSPSRDKFMLGKFLRDRGIFHLSGTHGEDPFSLCSTSKLSSLLRRASPVVFLSDRLKENHFAARENRKRERERDG